MHCGLFDALSGRFADGERLDGVPDEEHRLRSILGNLRRLFNARRGSLVHVPEYGLPDVTDLSRSAPEAVDALRQAIRETVGRFEPRLHRVTVRQEQTDPASPSLVFLLTAEIVSGPRVQFQTTIRSQEPIEIHPTRVP